MWLWVSVVMGVWVCVDVCGCVGMRGCGGVCGRGCVSVCRRVCSTGGLITLDHPGYACLSWSSANTGLEASHV